MCGHLGFQGTSSATDCSDLTFVSDVRAGTSTTLITVHVLDVPLLASLHKYSRMLQKVYGKMELYDKMMWHKKFTTMYLLKSYTYPKTCFYGFL